jgi:hypothetical protein
MAAVLSLVGLVDAVCLLDQEMTANQLRMFLLIASKNGGTSQVELAQQMQLTSVQLSQLIRALLQAPSALGLSLTAQFHLQTTLTCSTTLLFLLVTVLSPTALLSLLGTLYAFPRQPRMYLSH